ncbi:MAG: NTP transferase domain-containing protein [Gemmatimonadetes bacterium]|nr:NTP transferase domain-containing protein [Gemmatimonadota bacterium]
MSPTGVRTRITAAALIERRFDINRALIPCAGTGSRMRSVTDGAPKELLALGGRPALERALHECWLSQVPQAVVLVGPGKEAITEWVRGKAGTPGMPASITVMEQPSPRGLADAVVRARELAPAEPLAVILPSHLFRGDRPALAQVIGTYHKTLHSVVGLVEARAAIAATRGAVPVVEGRLMGEEFEFRRIPDPGVVGGQLPIGAVPLTIVGRAVIAPDAFQAIDAVLRAAPPEAEVDLVPAFQRMLARGQLAGRLVRGRFVDLSVPEGYADGQEAFAQG